MPSGIILHELTKNFSDVRAVDKINLDIEAGELFFLLGPSGCGKTTLLRCIAGFQIPDAGTIMIGDRDVTNLPAHLRNTGMVFQSYALWPHMTVAENVAFGLEMRKIGKTETLRQVQEALAMVQMLDRADYKPGQLSGGQQQRVALARALVIRPECLLLDEPLSNLDAKLRLDMRDEIRRICKSAGLTAVYVTHDQNEALSIADRIAILNDGRIQQLGTAQEIYRYPQNRFVAGFIGETNFIGGKITRVQTGTITVDTVLGSITCANNNPHLTPGSAITLSIRPEAIRLREIPNDVPNVFSGTAFDMLYLGEMAQHRISIDNVTDTSSVVELKAIELNPRLNARDGAQTIRFWFAADDVAVLSD